MTHNIVSSREQIANQRILNNQRRTVFSFGLAALCMISGSACIRDQVLAPPTADIEALYWELRTNYEAVQLSKVSPNDTVQLHAIPYTPDGDVWTFTGDPDAHPPTTITWTSSDASKVGVSPTGFVQAIGKTSGVKIFVRQQIGGVTHADTILVQVDSLTDPPVLTTFRIRPTDSLKRAQTVWGLTFPPIILDQDDREIEGLPVAYRSSNREVVTAGQGSNKWVNYFGTQFTGLTLISASTYAYGVAKTDTFTLEIGWQLDNPFFQNPEVMQSALPDRSTKVLLKTARMDIGPSGVVFWSNGSGQRPLSFTGPIQPGSPMDVIFDDPTHVLAALPPYDSGNGNIMGIPGDSTTSVVDRRRYRRFKEPGEYKYTIQPWGFQGVVVVHDR